MARPLNPRADRRENYAIRYDTTAFRGLVAVILANTFEHARAQFRQAFGPEPADASRPPGRDNPGVRIVSVVRLTDPNS